MQAEAGPWPLWGRVSRPKRQLPGHGDLGLLEADAFPQPVTSGFEPAPVGHPGEQHAGSLEEVGPEHSIAAFGDPPAPIDFARGKPARRQPDVGADRSGACGARAGSSIAEWKVKAVIGPMPGTVMERLLSASFRARPRSFP